MSYVGPSEVRPKFRLFPLGAVPSEVLCSSCGGDNDLRDYDDAGNVVFCRDCRETPDLDDLWVDLGVGG